MAAANCSHHALASAVAQCVPRCADGVSIIKRSQRLTWLTQQSDAELRAKGFFSPGVCFRCLNSVKLPAGCVAPISLLTFAHAIAGHSKHPPEGSYIVAAHERYPSFLFYTGQCTNQCVHLQPAPSARECYCRACATLPDWADFATFCTRFAPPDLLECAALRPLIGTSCGFHPDSSGTLGHAHVTPTPANAGPRPPYAAEAVAAAAAAASHRPLSYAYSPYRHDSIDAERLEYTRLGSSPVPSAAVASCRTAFNTSCCPAPRGFAAPCGGPGRGTCLGIQGWMREQRLQRDAHPSCYWPVSFGAARCRCEPRFAGHDCGGCARGYKGASCDEVRAPEVRRPFTNVTLEEASAWARTIGDALKALPSPLSYAPENELEMAHEFNRAFHASNWLNHFHILYFEEWIETVRRLAADYTTPYFYFDPSDRPSLARINGFIDAIEARRAGHKGSHAKPRPPPRKFDLDFRGNAPPDVVDALVRRVGVYFPFTATYNGRVFEANVTASALEADGGASIGGLGGTFSGYFQKLHATQQMVLVGGGPIAGGAGPCTPNLAHGYAEADALGCLPLGPSHAFYESLLRRWMEAHGREAACALESTDRDIPADACIPFIVPLTRPRDLCDRERQAWHTYV